MIAVVQRVSSGRVTVSERVVGEIERGLVVLAAVHTEDTEKDGAWVAGKIAGLRIFAEGGEEF